MPFEQIKVGDWLLEIDREATQVAYQSEASVGTCACDHCQNYYIACMTGRAHSPAASELFQSLGIVSDKEAEVDALYANEDKTQVFYYGFHHLVGRIITRPKEDECVTIDDRFEISNFTEKLGLISNQFPRPALEMNFICSMPWFLERREALGRL